MTPVTRDPGTATTPRADGATWRSITPGPAELDPRGYARRRGLVERGLAILAPVVLIGLWQLLASGGTLESNYFPAPTTIAASWGELIESGVYQESVVASVQRIVIGYLAGSLSAVVLGLLIGSVRLLRVALEPTIAALYTVPKLAILPLLLLIFGLGETSKILLVALTCFFVVLINTIDAVSGVSPRYGDVGRSSGASRWATLRHITLPAALPQTITGMRIASGLAVIVIVGAEFVAADAGLGFLVWNSWNLGVPEHMYVGIVSISVIGVIASMLLRGLEWLLTPWNR
ncbi:ABC transporter permease [Nonomuraea cavernae]|uniref:Nitrate ABC transporter permease n=1 Tax=Nonomuraea cavernae TaxID=2045107 RepID=A0A918DT11_9ACTN|nr:ABC transporter permease [Nonomuraea cavernae]MCA2186426.1 ABC transporter permease [Nonomuraea cavernae]GGO82737.1 nitrate ABC transporter permease [Nonomuraea cavernae]